MSTRATASFDVTGWDETPYDEPADGPQLARSNVRKTFRGDFTGESSAEVLMCQAVPGDLGAGAGYVASERVTAQLAGRSGTFVLQHGVLSGGEALPRTFGYIVPGSGTGDLTGLRGTAEIQRTPDGKHTLILDYEFGKAPAE